MAVFFGIKIAFIMFAYGFFYIWAMGGFFGLEIDNKEFPNQGIKRSFQNILFFSSFISVLMIPSSLLFLNSEFFLDIFSDFMDRGNVLLYYVFLLSLFSGISLGCGKYSRPVVQHIIIRLIAVLTRMRYRSIAQVYEFQGFS